MRPGFGLTILLVTLAGLAGCVDGGVSYTPRTIEATLVITQSTSETIPLYTLNDGESQMRVVAMGFQLPDQTDLRVPNPEIRLKEGDTLILTIINQNPLPHTFHMHGGLVPWDMDGVPFLNQMPIHNGEEYTYIFEDLKAGTYWYHCHVDVAHHIDLGMYGAFIVEEVDPDISFDRDVVLMLDEWDNCHVHGNTDPIDPQGTEQTGNAREREECVGRFIEDNFAQNQVGNAGRNAICNADGLPPEVYEEFDCDSHGNTPPYQNERTWYPVTYPVYNPEYNTFLINGKAFPDTAPIAVEEGERVKLRLINVGEEMHSMHLHGHTMLVTHRDGYPLPAPFKVDTIGIMPGERYDVIVVMDNPGMWAFHDHVGLNVMNDMHSPGGMFTCMAYDGFHGITPTQWTRAIECTNAAIEIFATGGGHDGHGQEAAQRILEGTYDAYTFRAEEDPEPLPTLDHTGRGFQNPR